MPGGFAPDRLRRYAAVLDLVRGVYEKGGVVDGKLITSRMPAPLPAFMPAVIAALKG